VKMSNNTNGRPSALPPELSTDRPRASDHAPSTVILLALSHFCEGSPAPLPHVGPAAAGISPSFSVPSAFVCVRCVKSFAFRSPPAPKTSNFYSIQMNRSPILQLAQNKPLHISHSSQIDAFLTPPTLQFTQKKSLHHNSRHFFYSTQMNGHYSRLTNHYSPITTHDSTKSRRAASPLRRGLVAVMLRREFRGVTCS
jgi:hypothetical protein